MALSGTDRGSGGNTTTSTTLAISPTSNFTPGTLAVLYVGYDNSGASGADPWVSTVDNAGNKWTVQLGTLNDPGAANAGSAMRVFTAYIGKLLTTDTITITFNPTTVSKAWTLMEVAPAAGFTAEWTNAQGITGATANPTVTSSVPNTVVGNMCIGAIANASTAAITADSDTTNGSWSAAQTGNAGNATSASNIKIISQYKVQTTTPSTQTYNITITANTWCAMVIEVTETAIPAANLYVTRSRVRA